MVRMKKWLASWVQRLLNWLDPAAAPAPAPDVSTLAGMADSLVRAAGELDVDGEYRRHRVYARLIKTYPTEPKRVLSRAIEDALDRVYPL